MSSLYGVRDCHIEAPVRMNELLIQGWGGPSVARGDHLRRHGRSGGTNFGGDQLSRDSPTYELQEESLLFHSAVDI